MAQNNQFKEMPKDLSYESVLPEQFKLRGLMLDVAVYIKKRVGLSRKKAPTFKQIISET